jgi:UDP-N-acetyl-2-amino-2-deoxyglucuronate dehydrogenase
MSEFIKPITDRKIRLGFVGCGRISQKHFEALEQHKDNIEVVAVCDSVESRASAAATRMGSKAYFSIDKMLAEKKLDVVTIATPNGLHPEHVMQIADSGAHVITEKPMSIAWNDGVKMNQHCTNKGVQLFVIHQNRFNDTIIALHNAITQGRFGKIYMITSNVFWTRPQEYYDKDGDWHGTKDMDGGAYLTQASHYVDLMQWIARAKPKSVFANLKTLARNIETEDSGVALFEWENNIIGSMNVTMLTYPKNLEGSVTVLGEKGTVRIGGTAMNAIEHWEFADKRIEDEAILNANYETGSVYGFGHVRYYENVIDVFRGKAKPLIDGVEGLKSLKLLTAIYDSSEQGKPIVF